MLIGPGETMIGTKTESREARSKALALGLLVVAFMVAAMLLTARPAHAATFTVNSTGDQNDLDFPGGTFDGSSDGRCFTGDVLVIGDECTLRAAIQAANKLRGSDTIEFDIPTTGVATIDPDSRLPSITRTVTINGYTQGDARPNTQTQGTDAVIKIRLDGFDAGLTLSGASNSVIRGLAIGGCLADSCSTGIFISGGEGYKIEGNFIGVAPDGTSPLANKWGVILYDADGSTVGGTTPAKRNLISGNVFEGVLVTSNSSGNTIQGNLIGTDRNGNPLGNNDSGVALVFAGAGNRILSNSIVSNGDLGIDLSSTNAADGVTANDDKDLDTGPNHLQNYPVITSATTFPTFTSINGTLNSTPSTREKTRTFTVQFFSNPSSDPSEGKTLLGEIRVTTNRQGKASFGFSTDAVSEGEFITATATKISTGDTSEFSEARVVQGPVIGP